MINNIRKIQLVLITTAVVLTIYLFMLPISKQEPKVVETNTSKNISSFDDVLQKIKKQFGPMQLASINGLEEKIKLNENTLPLYDSIALAWDGLNQSGIAAHYFEIKGTKDNAERSYIEAAYRYFDAFKSAEDSTERMLWVNKAIECYEKVIAINPKNLNAKTDLGLCYAEGTGAPMKGIMLLRDVVKENPNHENAQLNLGFLSLKSMQFDKALDRFDKVLAINPSRTEVYIYRSQTYLQMGDTAKAKQSLQSFIIYTKDDEAKKEAEKYLLQLSN